MKKALCLFILLICPLKLGAKEVSYPNPQGYVNDFADVISAEDTALIEKFANQLEEKTTAQIAVVTIRTTAGQDIETYAVKLFEKWGIGKKGKDNGVLLLVALDDRKLRIEIGYGLEAVIPDVVSHRIIQETIIPYFQKQNYSKGILFGALKIMQLIAQEYKVELSALEDSITSKRENEPELIFAKIEFLVIVLVIILFYFVPIIFFTYPLRNRHWYGNGGFGGGLGGGGFGGGFGGFGGGRSGGGGATGKW
ncbi:MAG: YgcG family protein [Candidatus Omnitrophica bacterium]|nr:YgcG family protein [Candidatus Omnitrophota bacterium]